MREHVLSIFLYLSRAVDCLYHERLLQQLEAYSVRGLIHKWPTLSEINTDRMTKWRMFTLDLLLESVPFVTKRHAVFELSRAAYSGLIYTHLGYGIRCLGSNIGTRMRPYSFRAVAQRRGSIVAVRCVPLDYIPIQPVLPYLRPML
ncbi:hypothetical protein J6590_093008 [Homalodisca vitripennis]|nr:hypothetical protein J6590_093008 [Homalodisca vitripennis]